MTEWQSIDTLNIKIPADVGTVTIENYNFLRKESGIYKIYNKDNKLMYIGQSKNLKRRISEHFRGKRKGYFIDKVIYFYVDCENEFITKSYLDMYETYLIRTMKPRYNVQQTAPMRYIK